MVDMNNQTWTEQIAETRAMGFPYFVEPIGN